MAPKGLKQAVILDFRIFMYYIAVFGSFLGEDVAEFEAFTSLDNFSVIFSPVPSCWALGFIAVFVSGMGGGEAGL